MGASAKGTAEGFSNRIRTRGLPSSLMGTMGPIVEEQCKASCSANVSRVSYELFSMIYAFVSGLQSRLAWKLTSTSSDSRSQWFLP